VDFAIGTLLLQQIRRLEVFLVLARQPIEGERFLYVLLDPAAKLGVGGLALGQRSREVAPRFGGVAPIVKSPALAQAIVVDLARHVVERVAQEVHVAALPRGLRHHSTIACLRSSETTNSMPDSPRSRSPPAHTHASLSGLRGWPARPRGAPLSADDLCRRWERS
jgi:hypothetical protein